MNEVKKMHMPTLTRCMLEDCLFLLLVMLLLPLTPLFYLIDAIFGTEIMCDCGPLEPRGDDD